MYVAIFAEEGQKIIDFAYEQTIYLKLLEVLRCVDDLLFIRLKTVVPETAKTLCDSDIQQKRPSGKASHSV